MFKKTILAAPILLALLAGCGGGDSTAMPPQQSTQGPVTVPAVATAPFVQMAQAAGCSDLKNRLWLIDGQQVFWDRKGSCPDAAWSLKLYGANPQALLCSSDDAVGGPVSNCPDESTRALFNTISQSLESPNLGLDARHTVQPIPINTN